ncbi:MAG: glycosyltransferase family 4 protein, partial [bacterium]|nr:glycosyltransferase family 4 protein [Candidatus Kapabacteria bacterium]
ARATVRIPSDDFTILYAGRLLEMKGIDDLIDAFAALASARSDDNLRLIILGAGDYESAIIARASATAVSDRIEIRGSVANEEIRPYMCAVDAFVLPSRAAWCEQFGRVLAEAMLVETPVIGSTSGEIPQVIGDGGFIYQADDVDSLFSVLIDVLDNPREVARRVAIGREKALTEYSVDAFARRTIDMIEELAGRPVRRRSFDQSTVAASKQTTVTAA